MFQKEIYNYPIDKVMEALGCRKGAGKDMWFSPLREESEASFHIDRNKNLWYDHGAERRRTMSRPLTRRLSLPSRPAIGQMLPQPLAANAKSEGSVISGAII